MVLFRTGQGGGYRGLHRQQRQGQRRSSRITLGETTLSLWRCCSRALRAPRGSTHVGRKSCRPTYGPGRQGGKTIFVRVNGQRQGRGARSCISVSH